MKNQTRTEKQKPSSLLILQISLALGAAVGSHAMDPPLASAASPSPAPSARARSDDALVREATTGFAITWNTHNSTALLKLWDKNGSYLSLTGRIADGTRKLETLFDNEQAGAMRDAEMRMNVSRIDFIRPDIALVDCEMSLEGIRLKKGERRPETRFNGAFVLVKSADRGWLIRSFRPTYFLGSRGD